ncbi:MAG: glycosyltransferase [Xenococcaceae cyanobacterium]
MTYLPQPPTLSERYLYVNPNCWWAWLGVLGWLLTNLSGIWYLTHTNQWPYLIYLLLGTCWIMIHCVLVLAACPFQMKEHTEILKTAPATTARVDLFIPCCNEELEVIRNTFHYAKQLTYPHLQIYCLDDGGSSEVKRLAQEYGFTYICRPNRGYMTKAGNLQYGLEQSSGDYILVLDADFVAASDMLEQIVPWMEQERKIAILQTPQYFDSKPPLHWVARGAAYCQEVFYRAIQPARDRINSSSICVGTNALYRREALEQCGGFYQVAASEDVHNGYNLLKNGWKIKFLPLIFAKGLCPDSVESLFKQHYRWCSGSMKMMSSNFFWGAALPLQLKLTYMAGVSYYPLMAFGSLVYSVQLITMIFFLYSDMKWYNIYIWLPHILLFYLIMPGWTHANWGLAPMKSATVFRFAYLVAFVDLIRQQTEGWIPSGSSTSSQRFSTFRWLLILEGVTLVICTISVPNFHFIPLVLTATLGVYLVSDVAIEAFGFATPQATPEPSQTPTTPTTLNPPLPESRQEVLDMGLLETTIAPPKVEEVDRQ